MLTPRRLAPGLGVFLLALISLPPAELRAQAPLQSRLRPPGALSGKTVFLSPGHGFYYHSTLGWITQRGNSNGVVEDFLTAELTNQYLAAYLENAGADVWTCRDRCFSTVEVIVDNGDAGYSESGTWLDTSSGGYGGDGRYAAGTAAEDALAVFTPAIPTSGLYPLYVYFNAGSNRSDSVLVTVKHAGGRADVRVNQQRDGYTWRYVGTFWWSAGSSQQVLVSNLSETRNLGRVVIADAVRIGGGMGSEPPNGGGPTSGRRRADECSVYWARYQGAPASVYNPSADGDASDDVTCRPRYAEFESEPGEDSVYVSVHSNAGGGTGTETYMYLDGSPAGSPALRDEVHAQVVSTLRALWDPAWTDRGTKTADFGELRLLDSMPGILVEIAFHDNPADAADELDPRFRRIVARGIYQGIARHFGGPVVVLLPEPPEKLAARVSGTSALLSWEDPPSGPAAGGAGDAISYRVYSSPNGFNFDGGTVFNNTSAVISGLPRGVVRFFRVTAVNPGGESFPSPVAAVRVPEDPAAPKVLVVDGFDRLDASVNLEVNESSALGIVQRQRLDRRANSLDYVLEHLLALDSARWDLEVHSASHEAVADGVLPLADYDLVDWFVGRDAVADDAFNPTERSRLDAYLATGGALFLSGEDIGLDLAVSSSAAARAFFTDRLKADLVRDDAAARDLASAGPLAFTPQESFVLSDGTVGVYAAQRPDVYTPLGGASAALLYPSGEAGAVQFRGSYRLVHLAFPFETVALPGARDLLGERAVEFLLDAPPEPPRAVVSVSPSSGVVRLAGGRAEVTLDGSASAPGAGSLGVLAFRWRKLSGPAGDAIARPAGWELARAGLGYGDGDDATVLSDMRGAYAGVFAVREFSVGSATSLRGLTLRVRLDDGCALYLNGVEVLRRNLAAGAAYNALAEAAVEPSEERVDLTGRLGLLRSGRNVLAVEVHNSSLDSSDLTFAAELRAEVAGGSVRLVAFGDAWFVHRGARPPDTSWREVGFEPTPRSTPVAFTREGSYRFALEVDDLWSASCAEVAITVLAEDGGRFRRGDANSSGVVDLADAVSILDWLFRSGRSPDCPDAADVNDSGVLDISDAVAVLIWLFQGGFTPPPPGPIDCGADPSADGLDNCVAGGC
jgi:N-acetylmuramoyl-L-alanine amidase